jgi:predicted O-methyltransferase YrrM
MDWDQGQAADQFCSPHQVERPRSRFQRFLARECAGALINGIGRWLNSRNAKLGLSYRPDSHFDFDRFPRFKEFFAAFSHGAGRANAGDPSRLYLLLLNIARVLRDDIPGDFAEVGVYQGNTAYILAQAVRASGRRLFLFDTFEGFPGAHARDRADAVPFSDTSLESVRKLVGTQAVCYVRGCFPESLAQIELPATFALVHLDCDLRDPMLAALQTFYPRLSPGGLIVLHDYCSGHWAEAAQAIDAFMADKRERLVLMPDKCGTAVMVKG